MGLCSIIIMPLDFDIKCEGSILHFKLAGLYITLFSLILQDGVHVNI